jgi:hypothetical protein
VYPKEVKAFAVYTAYLYRTSALAAYCIYPMYILPALVYPEEVEALAAFHRTYNLGEVATAVSGNSS